jgi:type I restriction enzyme S subunit
MTTEEGLTGLPATWASLPLKALFRVVGGSTPKSDVPEYWDGDVVWISPTDLSDTRPARLNGSLRTITEVGLASCGTTLVPAGSIILSTRAPIGSLGIAEVPLCTNQGCKSLVPRGKVDSSFYSFLLSVVTEQLRVRGKGTTFLELSSDELGGFKVPVPSLTEQTAIADFLDRETGKIDALVEEQRRLIELLKEKRQAVISHAVTKGLDPNAMLKPSGVEWLGDVPEHWEIRSISSISTKITNGYVGPTRDVLVDEGIRYLQSLHIKRNRISFDQPYFVTEDWSKAHSKSILEEGDVLIVQTGDIGQVAVVPSEFAGCNCHALIIVAPVREAIHGPWLSWVLNSTYGTQSLLSIQTGALHPHLNCGNVKTLLVPVPPIREQETIVAELEAQLAGLAKLAMNAELAVGLLQERRVALISAAVTGKIDVSVAAGRRC